MSEETKDMEYLRSNVLFFNSSSKDPKVRSTLENIIKKIERLGIKIEKGTSAHLTLDTGSTPDMARVGAIIFNSQNAHDAAGIRTLLKSNPHAHLFCIYGEDGEIATKTDNNGNISVYPIDEMTPRELAANISRKLVSITTLKQGYVLFFDPKNLFEKDREVLSSKGICFDTATTHAEFETKIRFHQERMDAVIIDADDRAPNLIHAARDANVQTISVVDEDRIQRKEIQDSDYVVIKKRKKFNSDQLRLFIEKCIVPQRRLEEHMAEIPSLEKTTTLGRLIYIMGPALSGKTTLSKNSLFLGGEDIQFSPKHSTRPLRINEKQGSDIISVDIQEFNRLKDSGEFFYVFEYRGNKYGVHKSVPDYLRAGKNVIQINPDFQQLAAFDKKIKEEFKQEGMVMPVLIFAGKKTLEERLELLDAPEDEIELRRSMLDSELELFDLNQSEFKYRFFSHNTQDPVDLTNRLRTTIQWEEANPGLSYEQTHKEYVNRVLKILTNRDLAGLVINNIRINVSEAEIKEFCSSHAKEKLPEDIFKNTFPLEVKYFVEPNHGRIGLYILDNKRLDPMERRIILDLLNYRLSKHGIKPKAISTWSAYHKESIFGLSKAVNGELCDGACYSLTDEDVLHPKDSQPFMISVGFAKECEGKIEIRNMKDKEIFELTDKIKPTAVTDYEFMRAVRRYKRNN
jgi:guanylate kinase